MSERPENCPNDEELKQRYSSIEKTAREAIVSGEVIGNPIFDKFLRGNWWSIAIHGSIRGSEAGEFLDNAVDSLKSSDQGIYFPDSRLFHLTFREVIFEEKRRREAMVTCDSLEEYYLALRKNFSSNFDPIRLLLYRIFPSLDQVGTDIPGKTASLVAAFLTGGDETIFKVREEIKRSVLAGKIHNKSPYGDAPKVLFVTIGRFREAPKLEEGKAPILDTIDQVNRMIVPNLHQTNIDRIHVISTSSIDYKSSRGHIEIAPSISLQRDNQDFSNPYLRRPSQRVKEN